MTETETDYNEKEKSYYKCGIKKLENRYVKKVFFTYPTDLLRPVMSKTLVYF